MKIVRIILSLSFIIYFNSSFTQEKKVNNPLQEQEIALLDIITADSIKQQIVLTP